MKIYHKINAATPPEFRGYGLAGKLINFALDDIVIFHKILGE